MQAAEYAIEKMFDGQLIIVPSLTAKLAAAAARVTPTKVLLAATGKLQKSRTVHGPRAKSDEDSLEMPVNTGADMKLRLSEEEIDRAISGIYDDIKDINDLK